MERLEKWIWLDQEKYPHCQLTAYSPLQGEALRQAWVPGLHESVQPRCGGPVPEEQLNNYHVAEFTRRYDFGKPIAKAHLRFSGDTEYQLYANGTLLATGPVSAGGDFLFNDEPRPRHYATEVALEPGSSALELFARVKLMPVRISEYSHGRGGFMLTAHVGFADGTETVICTDRTWKARRNGAYVSPLCYDGRIAPDPWSAAEEIANIWHTQTAPIPPRAEETVLPQEDACVTLAPGEEKQLTFTFPMICAGFLSFEAEGGPVTMAVECFETEETCSREELTLCCGAYRGFYLHSVGGYRVHAKNLSDAPARIHAALTATCYPAKACARTHTDDARLNSVLDLCTHTLKYCRQMMHLDSPRHCEPLACTADYYIETLMTAHTFGDMTLAKFDLIRTAELLRHHDGRMFHTTYSLIWTLMLRDVYRITADRGLIEDCEDALLLLLQRFEGYTGENGLVETPPDYMFIDWIFLDGYSLHHPPKALGQTCLNMFYFAALQASAEIYGILGKDAMSRACLKKAEALRLAVDEHLYDSERGLYFEGLNTPTPEELICGYMPPNTDKRYYRKHANILAAYTGLCSGERARELLKKVMEQDDLGDIQPYFAHYLLEAVYRCGLRDTYTLSILERWKKPAEECSKGLVEGFIPPDESYSFDHSHGWGGTPAYSLPKALLGLEILEPGYRRISLSPSLLGLERAHVEIPTPYGSLVCDMKKGCAPVFTVPEGICAEFRNT